MNFDEITRARFRSWADKLQPLRATPLVLLSVRHDSEEGGMVVNTLEAITEQALEDGFDDALTDSDSIEDAEWAIGQGLVPLAPPAAIDEG